MLIYRNTSYLSRILPIFVVGLLSGLLTNSASAAGAPSKIATISGNEQSGIVGTRLSKPFELQVKDSNGNPVSGATVVWKVVEGNGSFPAGSTVTNSSGLTTNTMTLGVYTSWNKATATTSTGAQVNVGANGTPGPATSIAPYYGNNQTAIVGSTLPSHLAVICKDKYGNTSAEAQVDWAVTSGGGSVPYYESPTVTGVAIKSMTLGKVPGVNEVKASIDGTGTSYTFSETANPGLPASMAITAGNYQQGVPGAPLASPFQALVTDKYGNPLSGVPVSWTANTAGDKLSESSNATATYGHSASTLTMGPTYGVHNATAVVAGTSIGKTFVAVYGVTVNVQDNPDPNPKAMQPYFLGLSYPRTWVSVDMFNANNATTLAFFKNLGPGVLRFLAEEPFDPVIWDPNGPGLIYGTVTTADIARVAAFAKAANWKVLYGIALNNNTPAAAASEAKVAAEEFGSSLLGFEIGNEPDIYDAPHYGNPAVPQIPGYTWQDYISPTSLESGGKVMPSWTVFAAAIRAAVPNAPLTGPTGGYNWAIDFTQSSEASKLSLLTMHYYAEWPTEPSTMTRLLNVDPRIADWLPGLDQAAKAADIPGGYRISECNSVSGNVPGITNAFGAALWTIDFLFENALNQSSGVNFSGGGHGTGYTPLQDNLSNITGVGPDYYGLYAYSLLDKGGKVMTTETAPMYSTFSTYAIEQTDGSTDVILNNKNPYSSMIVAVKPQTSFSRATTLLLTAPSLTSTSGFELGGSQIKTNGSWTPVSNPSVPIKGGAVIVTVPPGSAQLVHME